MLFFGTVFFYGDRHGDKIFGDKKQEKSGTLQMFGDSVRGHTFESGDSLGDRVLSPKIRGQFRGQKLCSQMIMFLYIYNHEILFIKCLSTLLKWNKKNFLF